MFQQSVSIIIRVLAKFVLRMRRNYYFRAFRWNSDTAGGVGEPDLLYFYVVEYFGELMGIYNVSDLNPVWP